MTKQEEAESIQAMMQQARSVSAYYSELCNNGVPIEAATAITCRMVGEMIRVAMNPGVIPGDEWKLGTDYE